MSKDKETNEQPEADKQGGQLERIVMCDCHLCKGTGKVDAEMNELDLLMQNFNDNGYCKVNSIMETAMNRFNVKKSKRKHIKRIIYDALQQLKY